MAVNRRIRIARMILAAEKAKQEEAKIKGWAEKAANMGGELAVKAGQVLEILGGTAGAAVGAVGLSTSFPALAAYPPLAKQYVGGGAMAGMGLMYLPAKALYLIGDFLRSYGQETGEKVEPTESWLHYLSSTM